MKPPAGASSADAALGVGRLVVLLVGLKARALRGGLRPGPGAGARRLAALLAIVASFAYVGLFLSALEALGEVGGATAERLAVGAVGHALVLAAFAAKVASGEAVWRSAEDEFLRCRPVTLPTLVTGRSLAAVLTDFFGAFFLLPILAAAALAWQLGGVGLAAAALTSILIQVTVSAGAQLVQIGLVSLIGARARARLWTALALASALAMACLWMAGSLVLRRPNEAAAALLEVAGTTWAIPLGWVAAPLVALTASEPVAAAAALGALAMAAVAALVAAALVARRAERKGWEAAGAPWVEANRVAPAPRGHISLFGRDRRQITRDRARLLSLVALPVIFVGVQVFGSAGWRWSTESPRNMAMLAYSLAAYMALLGPLRHMEAERHAFWIVLTAPRPLAAVMAEKAALWAAALATVTALVYAFLWIALGAWPSWPAIGLGALAVLGAALLGALAVGVACGMADLSDETKSAIAIGPAYLFLAVAALFNVALAQTSGRRAVTLALYVVVTALCWIAGVGRARCCYDADAPERRQPSLGRGALAAVLLVAIGRLADAASRGGVAPEVALAGVCCLYGLVAAGALVHLRPRLGDASAAGRASSSRWFVAAALALAAALLVLDAGPAAEPVRLDPGAAMPLRLHGFTAVIVAVVPALAEELVVRGAVQRGLVATLVAGGIRAGRAGIAAGAASAVVALLVFQVPGGRSLLVAAIAPAAALALTGSLLAAVAMRALLVLLAAAG